jgi:hypothetical protein
VFNVYLLLKDYFIVCPIVIEKETTGFIGTHTRLSGDKNG